VVRWLPASPEFRQKGKQQMTYRALTAQQRMVLGTAYEAVILTSRRLDPQQILASCQHCGCIRITEKPREAFEKAYSEATSSGAFEKLFASYNGDRQIIGLFGILCKENHEGSDKENGRTVLLGEFALEGSVPSYSERFAYVRTRYHAYLSGRIILIASLAAGIYGLALYITSIIHAMAHPRGHNDVPGAIMLVILLPICVPLAMASFERYRLLRQPVIEPQSCF
jgi:hypothetical protein